MAKLTFIGDPSRNGDGPNTLPFMGVTFTKNVPTDVPDAILPKLRANTHFRVEEPAPAKAADKKAAD